MSDEAGPPTLDLICYRLAKIETHLEKEEERKSKWMMALSVGIMVNVVTVVAQLLTLKDASGR